MSTYTIAKQQDMSALRFNARDHRYTLRGMVIQSVTQVIEPLINQYDRVPAEVRRLALLRGTLVHKLTEIEDRSDGDWQTDALDCGLDGYLDAWRLFKQEAGVAIYASEQRVYHHVYRYAGTLDRIISLDGSHDRLAILDLKTGVILPEAAMQTAAYMAAVNIGLKEKSNEVVDRYVVQLREDGTYRLVQYEDKSDIAAFLAALTLSNWRSAHA